MSPAAQGSHVRSEAVVDLDRIRANIATLREAIPRTQHMTVVKADAYGHGAVEVARAARASGSEWLGVALPQEALQLRAAGDSGPLLAWLAVPGDPGIVESVARGVDVGVGSLWALDAVSAAASALGRRARVHLKVDTGLGRGGCAPAEWADLLSACVRHRHRVDVVAIWSHLACGDDPEHESLDEQRDVFDDAYEQARLAGIEPEIRHLAASGAALTRPELRYDAVRIGIATYGISPGAAVALPSGVIPAMTWRATVSSVKRIPEGHGVSYGLTWRAPRSTSVALVPVGYADGMPRGARDPQVVIGGVRFPIVGRVSMDQVVVDVGDAPIAPGDAVVVFGTGQAGEPTAQEWAAWCDTIGYEIVTRVGPRVPRRHIRGNHR